MSLVGNYLKHIYIRSYTLYVNSFNAKFVCIEKARMDVPPLLYVGFMSEHILCKKAYSLAAKFVKFSFSGKIWDQISRG